MTFNTILFWI